MVSTRTTSSDGPILGGMLGFLVGASAMFATMYSTQAVLPTIGDSFGISPSRAGLTISVLVLALVVGSWIWGPLSDRIGRRRCLLAACALQVPATVAVAVAPTFGLLLAGRIAQGLIMPGLLVVGLPYVAQVFVPAIGVRAVGWYTVSLIVGGLVGRLGVAFASSVIGWRGALAVLALFPLAALVVMARGLPAAAARHRVAETGRFITRRIAAATLTGPAVYFIFVGVFTFIGYRLESAPFSRSPTAVSFVFVAWVMGAVAPFAGARSERVGWAPVAAAGIVSAAAGVAMTVSGHLTAIVAGLVLVTLGMFIVVTAAPIGISTARGVRAARASSVYYSVYYSAGALGAFLPGLAWQAFGWDGVAATCGIAVAVATAGAVLGLIDGGGGGRGLRRVEPVTVRQVGVGVGRPLRYSGSR